VRKSESYRPSGTILRKYQITVDEVNEIRDSKGWSKLDICIPPVLSITPTAVIQMEINKETKYNLAQIAKQKRVQVNQNEDELRDYQSQLKKDNKGKILEVDEANL